MAPKRSASKTKPASASANSPSAGSELDDHSTQTEESVEETELFPETDEEQENSSLPSIERDLKLEEEIEQETHIPVERIIEDVEEVGQVLDPMRMYLSEIGRHDLLTAEQQTALAIRIRAGLQAEERLQQATADGDEPPTELARKKSRS